MYIQGNLQVVFDALYSLGVIDPVLEKDWQEAMDDLPEHYHSFTEAMNIVNQHQNDLNGLITNLGKFDEVTLGYVAMEVAREFADYHTREELH